MTVAVIGLGYVGLPLAALIAGKGIPVYGIDKDHTKLLALKNGRSYIPDVSNETVQTLIGKKIFTPLKPGGAIRKATHIIVTVPTPLSRNDTPDLSALKSATAYISRHLQKGQTVICESSTFPGTLEEVVMPVLSRNGLQAGKDYYLGYSPERIDPGNDQFPIDSIPKVVSGYTKACLEHVKMLYDKIFETTVAVSDPKVAELCKLFENIQRLVNISLVNEMDLICREMNIDFREALKAAATKPFGFMPYWPGPGIGGHCIPVDPLYFQWKARKIGKYSRLIHVASQINKSMPQHIVKLIEEKCGNRQPMQPLPKIVLIGLAYKKDVNDIRESAAIDIFKLLVNKGYEVDYHDPYISCVNIFSKKYVSKVLNKELISQADVVCILTDHSNIDWKLIANHASSVVDTRGVLKDLETEVNAE